MKELHTEVLRNLNGRRNAAGAIRLWEMIHEALERDGIEGVEEILTSLTALPEGEEEGIDE